VRRPEDLRPSLRRDSGPALVVGVVVMIDCENRSHSCGAGALIGMVVSALLLGVAGCNPIATYRNWEGISANDPNPATTPNTKNLAAAETRSYPNLATVPPPPSQALTTAELQKLTQSLIADRANARYTSEHLQEPQPDEAPPSPPPAPAPAPSPGTGGAQPTPANPGAPGGNPAPSSAAVASSAPGSPSPAAPSSGAGVAAAQSAAAGPAAKGTRKQKQPPESEPMESSLQSPQIAALPQPQQNTPASPPPSELAMPVAPNPANPTAPGAHLPAPPPPAPMPAAIGSAQFEPAPPPPVLPPANPIRTATATGPGKAAKPAPPPAAFTQVAAITFSGDTSSLSEADRGTLGKLVSRYRAKPGLVRVVGYAGVASGATQELNSYRTALDRAQAVANALTKGGIPANKLQVEAAPTGSDAGQGRAEILFEQ
jgi:outer membrane protein OmpA-like peptidoglycan-associated protein